MQFLQFLRTKKNDKHPYQSEDFFNVAPLSTSRLFPVQKAVWTIHYVSKLMFAQ